MACQLAQASLALVSHGCGATEDASVKWRFRLGVIYEPSEVAQNGTP